MKRESEGVIIEIYGDMAKVKASRHGDCKNCGACPGDNAMIVDAKNPIEAQIGQRVVFEIKEVNMLKAAFVVYILPLVSIFLGSVLGAWVGTKFSKSVMIFQIAGGIIAFMASVLYIKIFDKSAQGNENMQPVITRILS